MFLIYLAETCVCMCVCVRIFRLGEKSSQITVGLVICFSYLLGSNVAQRVKRLPIIRETLVLSWGWEDPLEKEMATHSSILAWRIPRTEEPGGL